MLLIGDKVEGNPDMTVNIHIGREKLLCEKGCISQRKKKKRNNSQLLGLQTYSVNLFIVL